MYGVATSTATCTSASGVSCTSFSFVGSGGSTIALSAIPNSSLANSTISGISLGSNLANLSATDSTLTFSGTYNGNTARTIGLTLSNGNVWTAASTTFTGGVTIGTATTTSATTTNLYASGQTRLASLSGVLIGTTGVVSAGVDGTDYTLINAVSCTNQVMTALTAAGVGTCSSINNAYWSGTDLSVANGGTGLSTFGGTNTILYTTAADTLSSEAAFTYAPTTDLLTFVNASSTRLTTSGYTILASGGGNVGVGTTSPQSLLEVNGTIASDNNSVTTVGYRFTDAPNAGMGYVGTTPNGNLLFYVEGTIAMVLTDSLNNFRVPSDYQYSWSSATDNLSASDAGISRLAAGKLGVGNGTAGTSGSTLIAGTIGIGTTSPAYLLSVQSAADVDMFQLYDTDGNCRMNPESGGITTTCSSDERLKSGFAEAPSALEWTEGIHIREYTVDASGERKVGVVAQELQETHPELVHEGEDGFLSVELPNLWVIVKAVQELAAKEDEQDREIAELRAEIEAFKEADVWKCRL